LSLALVLLAGSGLLIRSFIRLVGVHPGFDTAHLLTFKVTLPQSKYGTDKLQMAFSSSCSLASAPFPESAPSPWRTIRR